ncbi:2-oxoacid:acceptor oxidoreductase subunit alpha [Pedosphaera parvula]|uniref:Pyruvate flavodoxin/ferredoxin oxidoreductase domain protein n=1 Tax=Pedosphaera parvula (strain Ellin514) TaxID=320771 RepID=B9XK19_PEDPL|nr:2-oxoacid:acceptor oxidoreductase subunit alpha [Pedosphaera parvula]EEF59842.1 pyruvate flavodoxin/ferredoxin oxidoreductase domain protein [Pedosphaera parvula Ellin514]
MSEATLPTQSQGGAPKVSKISEAVIRIAGNSQDGIQAIGGFLARLAGRSEQEVMTFMTIPATISGGPSIFQVRIGSGEVLSSGDDADVLLAFYQHSYEGHIGSLKKGGIVLYDSDHVEAKPELQADYHHVGVPISGLTVEAIGGTAKDKGKNIFALGLIAKMFDLNVPKLEKLVGERFTGKDPSILNNALAAFHAGYSHSLGNVIETFKFVDAAKKNGHQVVMNGNEAIGFGLIAAGVRFGAGYPITPWSDIMELLRRELPKYGGTFVQCEDEIASISMAIGGSYGGRVAVTGSSGPGISLKTEALGWAVMAEIPLIVVDIQRGGPSTGMPTNVEQSDLNIACFGGHGDSPRVVIAPANVEDCFYMAIEAVNIARKYNVPVILISDQAIATRIEAFEEPNLEKVCQDITPDLTPVADHKPYDLSTADGVTARVVPGTRIESGKYPIATGLEHDEMGHPTGSPKLHTQMTAKRRKKLQALGASLPIPKLHGPSEGNVLLVGWGSTEGPIKEAVDRARAAGDSVSSIHIRHINPLPPGLENIFAGFNHVLVVEMNDEGLYGYGQLGGLLRARYGDSKIRGLNKTDGLTFKVKEIVEKARATVATGMRKM